MRKNLIFTLFITIVSVCCNNSFAQLSGTKVIGTSPSDYTTFTAAVSALNSQGINGNIVFNVKPGIYTERISINQISGAAANKSITFQSQSGDSTSVTLQYASSASAINNYVVQLNGADFVTFQNITVKRTDTMAYSSVIDVKSNARHNTFANNIIEGNTKQSTYTYRALVTSDNIGKDCFNTFNNNIFRYGDFGIYFLGQGSYQPDSGNAIINNKFFNQAYRAMYFTCQMRLLVIGNTITSNSTNTNFSGIFAQYSNDTMRISKNKFALACGYGIYLANCDETVAYEGLISNNFIAIGGTSTANGIYLLQSKHQEIIYNSINIYSTSATAGIALNLSGTSTEFITIKNNALINTGGGYSYYIGATVPATVISASDYNDLFSTGTYLGFWKSNGNISTLANWKTISALETHSVSADPVFNSQTDLHVNNGALNGAATTNLTPIVISTDIDGDLRNPTTPDIGADEFSMAVDDLGISSILFNYAGYCPATNFNIAVRIRNYSMNPFSGAIPLHYQIAANAPVNVVTPVVNIASGDSMLYTFTNTQSLPLPGTYHVKAGTAYAADVNTMNDTTSHAILIRSLPVAQFTYQSSGMQISFTSTSTNATAYNWAFGDGGTASIQNPVHTYPASGSYQVRMIASNVCAADTSIQMIAFTGMTENASQPALRFGPNPATDKLSIYNAGAGMFEIISVEGQLMLSGSPTTESIDISKLGAGVYFIRFTDEKGRMFAGKFVKD